MLAVTGLGDDLAAARRHAYDRLVAIRFDGMQVRRDIGWRALGASFRSYAEAGVDIDEGTRAVAEMKAAVEATHDNGVLRGVGSFGGVFSAAAITALRDPVLVASTDGVGTKVELAARLGMVRGVGMDIVNHCIDDVLVQSARPLFFLDYIAASVLDADLVAEVVGGMAEACRVAGCALLGGETAEMPGVYAPGAFDIAAHQWRVHRGVQRQVGAAGVQGEQPRADAGVPGRRPGLLSPPAPARWPVPSGALVGARRGPGRSWSACTEARSRSVSRTRGGIGVVEEVEQHPDGLRCGPTWDGR